MKFYYHDPDAALSGMLELSLEQRGAYYSILDLLYSRDGIVPDDDLAVARMIRVHWRTWRALKQQLMAAGKLRVTIDGLLDANRVSDTLKNGSRLSQNQRRRASKRWQDYKNSKEINGGAYAIRGNATKTNNNILRDLTDSETSKTEDVDNEENFGTVERPSTAERIGSDELGEIIRAKRWAD